MCGPGCCPAMTWKAPPRLCLHFQQWGQQSTSVPSDLVARGPLTCGYWDWRMAFSFQCIAILIATHARRETQTRRMDLGTQQGKERGGQIERPALTYVHCCAKSCPTHCDPVDCSPPGSSVHGVLQARILEWVAISFSRGSSQPRDQAEVSCLAGRFFTLWATGKPMYISTLARVK